MTNNQRQKAWQIAAGAAKKQGLPKEKARPQELLLFAKLDASENQYRLSLKHDDQIKIAPGIARGLLDRDGYMATMMALGVIKVPVIATVEYFAAAIPSFWEDPALFPTVATTTLSESQALASIWWGTHTLQTNQDVRIDKSPNRHFRTVHQTQTSANTANMQLGIEMKEIGAAVRFGGGDDNEIIITLDCKDKTDIVGAATHNNYLMVVLDGAVIKGSTTKFYTK